MRATLLTAVAFAVVGFSAAWFFVTYERVTLEVPAGYQGEARFNGLFAAELLLRKLEHDADSRASLTPSEWLPPTSDTLLVRASSTIASAKEFALLERWVSSGGHLVLLAPEEPTVAAGAVFEQFGFRLRRPEVLNAGALRPRALRPNGSADRDTAYTLAPEAVVQSFDAVAAYFDGTALADERGMFAARRQWGTGYVTLVASASVFENPSLADFDHARLLLDSVAGLVDPGKIWLVYDASFPPLWWLIVTSAPYALIGAALAGLLWLWAAAPRFGPLMPPAAPERRSIIEHVEAAGRFVWRYDGGTTLQASSVAAMLRRVEPIQPGITRLSPSEQAERIAELTGESAAAVLAALERGGPIGQRELTDKIRKLQTIRKKL